MKITQDVIMDLLPAYLAGEASPDTKELVAEFLRQNPEFSKVLEAQQLNFCGGTELLRPAATPPADLELRTLARTRSLLARQKWSLALALMLTAFPLSFVFSGSHVTFILLRDQPLIAAASWLGAAVLWVYHLATRRRLRAAGI